MLAFYRLTLSGPGRGENTLTLNRKVKRSVSTLPRATRPTITIFPRQPRTHGAFIIIMTGSRGRIKCRFRSTARNKAKAEIHKQTNIIIVHLI